MRLKEKVALITGGGKGIGKSIAIDYSREGAYVILLSRNEKHLIETINSIHQVGGKADYVICDLSSPSQVENCLIEINKKVHKIDILINNSGILGEKKTIVDYPINVWREVIDININGMFYLTKGILPLMIPNKEGSIINVSSGVGWKGRREWGAYSVSKFAVEGFSQVLADELHEYNIRVNSVNPGATRTTMRAEAYPDEDPLTIPHPNDITEVFIYLGSDESKNITGKSLHARDYMRKSN